MIRPTLAMAWICLGLLTACGVATPPFPPAPAPLADPMPKPPVTPEALVWQPGHWDWNGTAYVWQPGQYVPATGHGPNWQPGWWNLINGGWRWEPAHWVDA